MSTFAELPRGTRLDVMEAAADRLVLAIPAGGPKTRSLFVFAFVWNVFCLGMTTFLVVMGLEFVFALAMLPFITLFVLVGLYLIGSYISMRFTRWNLLVTPEEVALQRIVFHRRSILQTELDEDSAARLVESYSQNGDAVYRVEIPGVQRTASFGTSLSRADKDWIVASVNHVLRRDPPETVFRSNSDSATEIPFEIVRPSAIDENSTIEVHVSSPQQLQFSTAIVPARARLVAVLTLGFVCFLWGGVGLARLLVPGGMIDAVGGGLLIALAAVPFALCRAVVRGRVTVTASEQQFETRVHWGILRKSFRRETQSAEKVTIQAATRDPADDSLASVIVQLGHSKFLAGWGTVSTCREIAGLVRYQFEQLGIETSDMHTAEEPAEE